MIAEKRKFLFDTEFGAAAVAEKARSVSESDHFAALEQARQEGRAMGFAEGEAQALQSIARARAIALETIAEHLATSQEKLAQIEPVLEAEAINIALETARKLAGSLVIRHPMEAIRALVADCFQNLRGVPHLVVRVHDDLLEDARSELEKLAREKGFEGRLVILAEPVIQPGDCRIEWASGGMVLDRAETEQRIVEAVNRFMGPRLDESEPPSPFEQESQI